MHADYQKLRRNIKKDVVKGQVLTCQSFVWGDYTVEDGLSPRAGGPCSYVLDVFLRCRRDWRGRSLWLVADFQESETSPRHSLVHEKKIPLLYIFHTIG